MNAALDIMRSRKSSGAVPLDDIELNTLRDPGLSPSGNIRMRRNNAKFFEPLLRACIPQPPRCSFSRYFEGYDNTEVAQDDGDQRRNCRRHPASHTSPFAKGIGRNPMNNPRENNPEEFLDLLMDDIRNEPRGFGHSRGVKPPCLGPDR